MRSLLPILGACLLLIHRPVAAAEVPPSFEGALRGAFTSSPEIRRDGLGNLIAELDIMRARSAFLPRLDLSVDDNRISLLGDIQGLESLQLGGRSTAHYATTSLKISLNLFNGGQDKARLDRAREKQQEAELQVRRRRVQIAQRVLDRFHTVVQAQFNLLIVELRLMRSRQILSDVEAKVATGRTPAIKRADAEFDVKEKELEFGRRRRALKSASEELRDTSGPAVQPSSADQNGWPDFPDYAAVLFRFGLAPSEIVTDVALYESRRRGAINDIPKAKGRFAPTLDLVARQDYSGVSTSSYIDALSQLGKDKRFIGFAIRWNFFEGGDAYSDVRQAALRVESAQADLDLAGQEQLRSERERTRTLDLAEEELELERERLNLVATRLKIDTLKVELGKAESSVKVASEVEYKIQSLEVRRREENVGYARAILTGDRL